MTLCTVFSVHWLSLESFRKNFFPTKKPYFEVRLLNRCLLHERYFSIEILGKDKKFHFQNQSSSRWQKRDLRAKLNSTRAPASSFGTSTARRIFWCIYCRATPANSLPWRQRCPGSAVRPSPGIALELIYHANSGKGWSGKTSWTASFKHPALLPRLRFAILSGRRVQRNQCTIWLPDWRT